MATILLTGGAGFIGSHVADALLTADHRVVIIDDLSTGRKENVPKGAEFHTCDIRSPDVEILFAKSRFDAVIHHAAQIDVRRSMREPVADADVNVLGSLRLMECCRRNGGAEVHLRLHRRRHLWRTGLLPADENHPARPVSIYGADKLAVEQYLFVFHLDCGLNVVALRYANVYGPRQNPLGEAGVVAIFTSRMLGGKPAIINGDGLQTRDYVFVGDVARMNLMALQLNGYNILNVGTGIETDVVTLFGHLNALTAADQPRRHGEAQPGEQRRSCINSWRALEILGWEPEMVLESGLFKTVEWFNNHPGF